jgi:hypothetical protein
VAAMEVATVIVAMSALSTVAPVVECAAADFVAVGEEVFMEVEAAVMPGAEDTDSGLGMKPRDQQGGFIALVLQWSHIRTYFNHRRSPYD